MEVVLALGGLALGVYGLSHPTPPVQAERGEWKLAHTLRSAESLQEQNRRKGFQYDCITETPQNALIFNQIMSGEVYAKSPTQNLLKTNPSWENGYPEAPHPDNRYKYPVH